MLVQFNIQLIHWLLFLLEKSWNAFIISLSLTGGCLFRICLLKLTSQDRINFSSFAPYFYAFPSLMLHTCLLEPQEPFGWGISLERVTECYLRSFPLSLLAAAGMCMHHSAHTGQATLSWQPIKALLTQAENTKIHLWYRKARIKLDGIIQ